MTGSSPQPVAGIDLSDLQDLWDAVEVDDKERKRFLTYANYLEGLGYHLRPRLADTPAYMASMVNSSQFKSIQGGRCLNLPRVGELLRAAWMTEVQMHISAMEPQFAAMTIHWLPVKGYYALYLLARSWLLSKNDNTPHDHTKTLAVFSGTIRMSPDLFPEPWKWLCTGEPTPSGPGSFLHLPNGVSLERVSSLAAISDTNYLSSTCLFLKTTRQRKVDQRIVDWKKQKRMKRLPSAERPGVVAGVHDTSLFDALYRLRIRSNYDNADSFIVAATDVPQASRFHENLRTIIWGGCLVLETLVARTIGKKEFDAHADRFLKSEPGRLAEGSIQKRWGIIKTLW